MSASHGRARRFGALGLVGLVLLVAVLVAVPTGPGVGATGGTRSAGATDPPAVPILPAAPSLEPATFARSLLPAGPSDRFAPLPSALPAPFSAGVATRAGPGPLVSDPANPELANYSSTTAVTSAGPSNQTVVVGTEDLTTLAAGSWSFLGEGLSAAFRSTDGGALWSSAEWLGQNASWASASSESYGDIDAGEPSLAGGANGTVLYATIYAPGCIYVEIDCNSTLGPAAPAGIAVARSSNSGATWSAPEPVNNQSFYKLFSITCEGAPLSAYLPANISDKPSVAYSAASGEALLSWDVLSYTLALSCQGPSGVYEITGLTLSVDVSVSVNNGVTWSAPKTVGRINTGDPASEIGPAPSYPLSVVYDDDYNGSATSHSLAYSQSTDAGAKWSAPVDLGPYTLVYPNNGTEPDQFLVPTLPSYAVDNWSASSFRGDKYVVVGSNLSASAAGTPSVLFLRSAAGSSTWSGAAVLDRGNATTEYFEPTVTVGPTGRVWVVFYELATRSGDYQLYGQYSDDGGSAWTSPFAIADAPSAPGVAVTSIGAWVGAAATSAGLYSAWTDCRWAGCATDQVTAAYAALTEPVTISSGLPTVVATAASSGQTTSGAVPFSTAWDNDATVAVSVPGWVPLTNTTDWVGVFSNFTGLFDANSASVAFGYGGGGSLVASYSTAPAAWISGTVYPASADPTVTVEGQTLALSPYNGTALAFNESVEGGSQYSLSVSAFGYTTVSRRVLSQAGASTPGPIVLARADGYIHGRLLAPFPATVTVNGTPVTTVDPTTGVFNVSVAWGAYWVNATGPGLDRVAQFIAVAPGLSSEVNLTLVGAWIDGTVAPGNASVEVDGTPVTVTGGVFNVSVPAGAHTVTAEIRGYSSFRATVDPVPGTSAFVTIAITDYGTILGSVAPVTASVLINGAVVPVVSGTFRAEELAGSVYNVTVAAPGYEDGYANVPVTPANTSFANFTLAGVPGCTSHCGGSGGSPGATGGATSAPFSWLDVGVAAAVILGAALVAGFLLLRPPGSGTAPPEEASPDPDAPPPGDEAIYGAPNSDGAGSEAPPPS